MKIYAKVLAHRINKYLAKRIYCDQTGFVQSRYSSDNLRILLHILHLIRDSLDILTSCGSLDGDLGLGEQFMLY